MKTRKVTLPMSQRPKPKRGTFAGGSPFALEPT